MKKRQYFPWIAGLVLLAAMLACARTFRGTPTPSGDTTHSLTFDGLQRSYLLHVPVSYDGSQPVPLVLDFHGGLGNASSQERVGGFNAAADENDFIVVYPNGTALLQDKLLAWNGGTCCGNAARRNVDDVGFVRAVVAQVESVYRIDPRRIYATGLSNGGIFANRLACDAPDLVAAIASVSGTLNYPSCDPKQPVSVIEFHGTADEHVPYQGGVGDKSLAGVPFASVGATVDAWLKFDGCAATPQRESFSDIRHDTYSNCQPGVAVELYTIVGGKHAWPGSDGPAWPGGDQPTQTISATRLMWAFFMAHPKP